MTTDTTPVTDRRISVVYTNHRGETAVRNIIPLGIRFGTSEWHREPQWLLRAIDVDREVEREFALLHMAAGREIERLTRERETDKADLKAAVEAARTSITAAERERGEALPWMLFYRDGLTLGEIAKRCGGGLYDYAPGLTAPLVRTVLDVAEDKEFSTAVLKAERDQREAAEAEASRTKHLLKVRNRQLAFIEKRWLQAAKRALAGDTRDLRLRVDLANAPPMEVVTSDTGAEATPGAEAEATALRERVAALEAGLKPFADIAEAYSESEDDDFQVWHDFDTLGSSLPLRIFRAARALVEGGE